MGECGLLSKSQLPTLCADNQLASALLAEGEGYMQKQYGQL